MTIKFKLDGRQTLEDAITEARLHLEALQDAARSFGPGITHGWKTVQVIGGELHLPHSRPRAPGEWR